MNQMIIQLKELRAAIHAAKHGADAELEQLTWLATKIDIPADNELNSKFESVLTKAGCLLMRRGRHEVAKLVLNRAIGCEAGSQNTAIEARVSLSKLLCLEGEKAAALTLLQECSRLASDTGAPNRKMERIIDRINNPFPSEIIAPSEAPSKTPRTRMFTSTALKKGIHFSLTRTKFRKSLQPRQPNPNISHLHERAREYLDGNSKSVDLDWIFETASAATMESALTDRRALVLALIECASALSKGERREDAVIVLNNSIAHCEGGGLLPLRGQIFFRLGLVHRELGHVQTAFYMFTSSKRIAQKINSSDLLVQATEALANIKDANDSHVRSESESFFNA